MSLFRSLRREWRRRSAWRRAKRSQPHDGRGVAVTEARARAYAQAKKPFGA